MNLKYLFMIAALTLGFASNAMTQKSDVENGIDLFRTGEYQKSIDIFEKALGSGDKNQDILLYLGMAYSKLGNSKKAEQSFNKAAQLEIHTSKSYFGWKVVSRSRPSYTSAAKRNNVQGVIKLAFEIGLDGKVGSIFIFQNLPDGLAEKTIDATRKMKIRPAIKNGKPDIAIVIYTYDFSLD